MTKRRVVVTGLGMLSPLGLTVDETWRRLLAGESGIGEITHFDCSDYSTRFAGQVDNFDPQEYIEKKKRRKWTGLFSWELQRVNRPWLIRA